MEPSEWFDLLNARFTAPTQEKWQDNRTRPVDPKPRNQILDTLWSYYTGDPPLPLVAAEYEDIFKDVMRKARCNYAPMCVAAMLDRMELQAISTPQDRDTNGDDVAAQIMEESGFTAQFNDTLSYMFALGEGFAMVVPGVGKALPTVHAIDPRRCVAIPDPNNPVRVLAALVRQYDPIAEVETAHLFLPGEKWTVRFDADSNMWRPNMEPEIITGIDELGGIPVVRFENKHGAGEFEEHIDLLDRINDVTLKRMVLIEYQSFRQRAVVGDLEGDEDDDEDDGPTDEPDWADIFRADPGALWRVPKDVTFWESNQADLTPILNAKRDDVKEFAAVTSTPLHLVTPDAANGSAQGAGLMRESATSKVRDRRARVTPAAKLLWRIALTMAGYPERKRIQLHWGPIEFRTLAEKGAASSQAVGTLSLEKRAITIWEMSPEEAADNAQELAADAMMLGAAQATPVPQVTPPTPPAATDDPASAA
ncbi:phage portal protein [Williamsia muralis]|uniref:phage portal protein n=1 Tax=Williamsia marianensis TaxID=85044 RepID=UPI003F5CC863